MENRVKSNIEEVERNISSELIEMERIIAKVSNKTKSDHNLDNYVSCVKQEVINIKKFAGENELCVECLKEVINCLKKKQRILLKTVSNSELLDVPSWILQK